jgi:SnoaL-like protein
MKKHSVPLVFVLSVLVISCNNHSGVSDRARKNLETATAIAKMFESHDWDKVGDYIAPDAVDHSGPRGEVKGLDNIKAEFQEFGNTMSDMKNEVVKELADDDYAFQWMKESWTLTKDDMGMKAGSKMSMDAIEVSKFNADGKLTDHWSFISVNDMMKMMPQGNMGNMGTDTSKMKMDTLKH